MAYRAMDLALLLSILPIAGCGTAANLCSAGPDGGGMSPFGGVRQDAWCMEKAANGEFGFKACANSESQQYPQIALILFCAADLPLSFVGDVVTWPYTAAYSFINQPIPTPPVLPAPGSPVAPTTTESPPQMPPLLETLPEPRTKLP